MSTCPQHVPGTVSFYVCVAKETGDLEGTVSDVFCKQGSVIIEGLVTPSE